MNVTVFSAGPVTAGVHVHETPVFRLGFFFGVALGLAAALALTVGILATTIPAYRATRVEPVRILREE